MLEWTKNSKKIYRIPMRLLFGDSGVRWILIDLQNEKKKNASDQQATDSMEDFIKLKRDKIIKFSESTYYIDIAIIRHCHHKHAKITSNSNILLILLITVIFVFLSGLELNKNRYFKSVLIWMYFLFQLVCVCFP